MRWIPIAIATAGAGCGKPDDSGGMDPMGVCFDHCAHLRDADTCSPDPVEVEQDCRDLCALVLADASGECEKAAVSAWTCYMREPWTCLGPGVFVLADDEACLQSTDAYSAACFG